MAAAPPKLVLKSLASGQDARAIEEAERQDRHRTEALSDDCAKVEEDLEALKARFELYFLGIERREPARERSEMKRRVAKLKGEFTRNAGLRFRIETLNARFLSYERMWTRSARQKEDGTYRRDLLKARRRVERERRLDAEKERDACGARAEPPAAQQASASPAAGAAPGTPSPTRIAPEAPPVPAAAPRADDVPRTAQEKPPASAAARPSPPPPGMTEAQLRALFDAYVDAKRRCNEDLSKVSYEALARSVARQAPELMAKYKARTVEFKVVIKEGRTILKAVPRV